MIRVRDMSYFDLSLDAVNKAYSWGWRLSLAAAVSTALGVLLLMWVARVRELGFEQQVATLHSRAATSEERAAVFEREAARLRLNLERENAELRERQGAETRAREAAELRTAEPKTELPSQDSSQLASRRVTSVQRDCLLGRLQRVKVRVVLRFEPNQEAAEYAVAIRDIYTKAGVPVAFGSASNASGLTGIRMAMIMTPGEGEPLPAAKEMSSILQDCGIPLERPIHWRSFPRAEGDTPLSASRTARPPEVLIFVGEKPPVN